MMAELVDEVRAVTVQVAAVVKASEARLAYRVEHGRALSKAHVEALDELAKALSALRERIQAILEPPPDPESLRAEFEDVCVRLEQMEVER